MTDHFDYTTYDRQLSNLLLMSKILVEEYEDSALQEINCDLRSLRSKAARLCGMTDTDFATQQDMLTCVRRTQNEHYLHAFRQFINQQLTPLLRCIIDSIRSGSPTVRPKEYTFTDGMTGMLPQLASILPQNEEERTDWTDMTAKIQDVEALFARHEKHTVFPGIKPAERLLYLIQYFLSMCYLQFHFQRLVNLFCTPLSNEEAGRLLQNTVQRYAESQQGHAELERYATAIVFDNDGKNLSVNQLLNAQHLLRQEVPTSLQLCFMQHINDLPALASAILQASVTDNELSSLIAVIAKWQRLSVEIETIEHPESLQPNIYNEVFHTQIGGRLINLHQLREQIRKLLPFINAKHDWFCLWCVLRHRGLLKSESAEAFFRQMMHSDWFADINPRLTFTSDTLRAYCGYLNTTDFTRWDFKDFALYRSRLKKDKKWSNKLFNEFIHLCHTMDEEMEEKL